MTQEELYKLYEEVTSWIDNYESYHVWYCCRNAHFHPSGTNVWFEVHGHSDQGSGADWTEGWSIDSDGKIYSEEKQWNSIEDFKTDFV